MVREIGNVATVVNADMVLIRVNEQLSIDSTVLVFQRHVVTLTSDPNPTPPTREIIVPIGRLNIIMDEGDGLYLAERYRETIQRVNPLLPSLSFLKVETTQGPWSATIDHTGKNPIQSTIGVGNFVGVEE